MAGRRSPPGRWRRPPAPASCGGDGHGRERRGSCRAGRSGGRWRWLAWRHACRRRAGRGGRRRGRRPRSQDGAVAPGAEAPPGRRRRALAVVHAVPTISGPGRFADSLRTISTFSAATSRRTRRRRSWLHRAAAMSMRSPVTMTTRSTPAAAGTGRRGVSVRSSSARRTSRGWFAVDHDGDGGTCSRRPAGPSGRHPAGAGPGTTAGRAPTSTSWPSTRPRTPPPGRSATAVGTARPRGRGRSPSTIAERTRAATLRSTDAPAPGWRNRRGRGRATTPTT